MFAYIFQIWNNEDGFDAKRSHKQQKWKQIPSKDATVSLFTCNDVEECLSDLQCCRKAINYSYHSPKIPSICPLLSTKYLNIEFQFWIIATNFTQLMSNMPLQCWPQTSFHFGLLYSSSSFSYNAMNSWRKVHRTMKYHIIRILLY